MAINQINYNLPIPFPRYRLLSITIQVDAFQKFYLPIQIALRIGVFSHGQLKFTKLINQSLITIFQYS